MTLAQTDFVSVTEMAGSEVSSEQVDRLCHRYYWAAPHCRNKDVVEVACGTGPGLGYLSGFSRTLEAGDCSEPLLVRARAHYGTRVPLRRFDAQRMPFGDASRDVVIIFEALYYLPAPQAFVAECRRILRPGGQVLVATANKDLPDFNPSPYSHHYHGVLELQQLFGGFGFNTRCWGYLPFERLSVKQRVLRPVKQAMVLSGLFPKTAEGKKWMKRLVFGKLVPMPAEIIPAMVPYTDPTPVMPNRADKSHKVLYCLATLA